jgi:hypothetical protein
LEADREKICRITFEKHRASSAVPLNPLKKEVLKLKIGSPPRKKKSPHHNTHGHSQRVDKSSRNCQLICPNRRAGSGAGACWKKLHRHLVRTARRSEIAKFARPAFPGLGFHLVK